MRLFFQKTSICVLLFTMLSLAASGQSGVVIGSVVDQFGSLPGAKIKVEGSPISVVSDVNGKYLLELESGDHKLFASFVMYLTQDELVRVVPNDTIKVNFRLQPGISIDQPINIGSRGKPRALLETTVPIDVITPQQLFNSSHQELGQMLHFLAPSFHSTHQTISDGTDFIDPSTLRGLGPDQVLVLVNGKRRHSSALLNVNGTLGRGSVSTDFNAIPVAAVDRIEILRDGAAAQYGSDAIAGVVNIILKEQTGITQIDNSVGVNGKGDGLTSRSSVNMGFAVGKEGFINATAEFKNRKSTNRAGAYTGRVYDNDPVQDRLLINQNDFYGSLPYDENRVMEIGNSATQNLSLSFNGEIPLSPDATFYAHGGYNFREGLSHGFYRFPKDVERVVPSLYPNGFSPAMRSEIRDNEASAGIRGIKNGWNIDVSHTFGGNGFDINVENSNNASLGVASPTKFFAGGFRYIQNTTNLDISRTFNYLSGINLGFGAELRVENYEIEAGEENSWINGGDSALVDGSYVLKTAGAQLFPGFQPENELTKYRSNKAAYIDLESQLSEDLILGIAGRYESYSDFGDQFTWKLSSRYKFSSILSFNVGYSTGFRAPSLHQVYFNNIGTQFVNGEAVQVGTFNNESAVAQAFGIEPLAPELSKHLTGGVAVKLSSQLTFIADLYNIKIEDRIVLSGRFGAGYEAILDPLQVGAAQFFTNAIDSKTTGMDTRITFSGKSAAGKLNITLAANVSRTRLDGQIKVSEALQGQEEVLFNREEVSRVESVQPSYKIINLNHYQYGKLTFGLNNTLFGRVRYIHPDDGSSSNWVLNELTDRIESRDQLFSPKLVSDVYIGWTWNDNVKWFFGSNNVLNIYPDKHIHSANINDGSFVYSRRVQQFGVKGSYFFVRLLISL